MYSGFGITDFTIDLERARREATRFMEWYPISDYRKQWSLTFRKDDSDQDPAIIRDTRDLIRDGKLNEGEYTEFHYRFRDTAIYELYQEISKYDKLGRCRILGLHPHQCYSLHADEELRYHVALWTNPESHLIINTTSQMGKPFNLQVHHVPADGNVYIMDSRHPHTAFNGGSEMRYHLVFNMVPHVRNTPPQS